MKVDGKLKLPNAYRTVKGTDLLGIKVGSL